jgi:predicted aspartyl protease
VRIAGLGLLLVLSGCASSTAPGRPPVTIQVPIQLINNVAIVAASINGGASALLIVDTGASATILTPRLLQRLDLMVPADAPRRQLTVMGGQRLDVPFIKVATIAIGDAVLKDHEVGVWDMDPQSPILGGLLGGDILHRFRVTLDRVAKRMLLEPLGP